MHASLRPNCLRHRRMAKTWHMPFSTNCGMTWTIHQYRKLIDDDVLLCVVCLTCYADTLAMSSSTVKPTAQAMYDLPANFDAKRTCWFATQNLLLPKLGAAGSHYARSVRPETVQPAILPEPETIFDSLLARTDFKENPNKISSVLFYLASIIIHGMYLTSNCTLHS